MKRHGSLNRIYRIVWNEVRCRICPNLIGLPDCIAVVPGIAHSVVKWRFVIEKR